MYSVSNIAKQAGITRTSVLYYERVGLIQPTLRDSNGYRWYSDEAVQRLKSIVSFRGLSIPVADIGPLLDRNEGESQTTRLRQHLNQLEQEIRNLREQQRAIMLLLNEPTLLEQDMVTKERWVEIMVAAGFDEQAMTRWHQKFEELEPEEHQKFLESLGIEQSEIEQIRAL